MGEGLNLYRVTWEDEEHWIEAESLVAAIAVWKAYWRHVYEAEHAQPFDESSEPDSVHLVYEGMVLRKELFEGVHGVRITINGDRRDLTFDDVTYKEVVVLAGKTGTPTVTYSKRIDDDTERAGTLQPGQRVEDIDGMTFDVIHTTNA